MKLNLTVLTLTALLVLGGSAAIAQDHADHEGGTVVEEVQEGQEAVNVGNKFCPISGAPAGSMEEGATVEHEGKVYNLCCAGCAKTFKEDPEAAIQKINEELEAPAAEVQK